MGSGNSIGAVTHLRYAAPGFILAVSPFVNDSSCFERRHMYILSITFSGDMASHGASDAIATTEMP